MSRKKSKYGGNKPEDPKPATLADTTAPQQTSAEYSRVDPQALIDRQRRKSGQNFPAVQRETFVEGDSIAHVVQKASEQAAAAMISNLPARASSQEQLPPESRPTSESDFPTPIPRSSPLAPEEDESPTAIQQSTTIIPQATTVALPKNSYEDDGVLEVVGEVLDEDEAAQFLDEMAVEEMVDDAFAGLQGDSDSDEPKTIINKTPSEKPAAKTQPILPLNPIPDDFDLDLSDLEGDGPRAGVFQFPQNQTPHQSLPIPPLKPQPPAAAPTIAPPAAPTIAPPPLTALDEHDVDLHQTGDYTCDADRLWEFLNSPSASIFHEAQKKFELTKNIADKPDLDALVRDFHRRKGSGIKS